MTNHKYGASQQFADARVRRNESKGVLIAGVPSLFSPTPLPFSLFPFFPIPYPFRRPLRRLTLILSHVQSDITRNLICYKIVSVIVAIPEHSRII